LLDVVLEAPEKNTVEILTEMAKERMNR